MSQGCVERGTCTRLAGRCVAFADYPRFLRAFKRGEITHMVIVDSIEDEIKPTRTLASLFSRRK